MNQRVFSVLSGRYMDMPDKAKDKAKPTEQPDQSAIISDLRAQLAAMTVKCQAAEDRASSAERRLDEALQSARALAAMPKLEVKPSAYDVRVTSRDANGRLENIEVIPKKTSRLT